MTPNYQRLQQLLATNVGAVLPEIVALSEHDSEQLTAQAILEQLVDVADTGLMFAIESQAATDDGFAHVVAAADVSDISGPVADQFRVVQRSVRERLPDVSHWEGWLPISPRDIPQT